MIVVEKMDVDVVAEDQEQTAGPSKMKTEDENEVPEPELAKLWQQLARVMDDVHEGTRLAAEGTAKALSKICVIAAASNGGKSGESIASSILPFILETGVVHTVPEIRSLR